VPIIGKLFSFKSDTETGATSLSWSHPHTDDGLGSVAHRADRSSTPTGTSPAQAGLVSLPLPRVRGGSRCILRFSTAGESHGKALVALVEGLSRRAAGDAEW